MRTEFIQKEIEIYDEKSWLKISDNHGLRSYWECKIIRITYQIKSNQINK